MFKKVASLVMSITIALLFCVNVCNAAPYQQGTYSSCTYGGSESCLPEVTVVPTPAESKATITGYTLNLTDGQEITGTSYDIIISLIDTTDASLISKIEVYVDGVLVGNAGSKGDGTYLFTWNTEQYPGTSIKTVVYDSSGNVIEKTITVTRTSTSQEDGGTGTTTGNDTTGDSSNNYSTIEGGFSGFVKRLSTTVTTFVKAIPKPVAISYPYALLFMLLFVVLLLVYRAQREARFVAKMQKLLKKQQQLANEKDNFISLSSHYLRTPLTVIEAGLGVMNLGKGNQAISDLQKRFRNLAIKVEELISQVTSDQVLAGIKKPSQNVAPEKTWKSPLLWVPIALVGSLVIIGNLLFTYAGELPVNVISLLTQILMFSILAIALFNTVRDYRARTFTRRVVQEQIDYGAAIDNARNTIIIEGANLLRTESDALQNDVNSTVQNPSSDIVASFKKFSDTLTKFNFAAKLESGKIETAINSFNITEIVGQVSGFYVNTMQTRNIKLATGGTPVSLTQHQSLVTYSLGSILENAIKYSPDNETVTIDYKPVNKDVSVSVSDRGQGITKDQVEQLFKPFSRGESVLEYNYEGLGFGLFLVKLIASYLGGSINIDSQKGQGSTFTINIPTVANE